jgi:hypothetical protein
LQRSKSLIDPISILGKMADNLDEVAFWRADDNRIRSLINEHDEYLNKHRPSIGPIVADKKSNILSCKLLILKLIILWSIVL